MNGLGYGEILLVDDNHEVLSQMKRLLSEKGYKVFPADSGELALATLENLNPDLILLDIHMPGMNGFEVCKKIKSNQNFELIPIIFLTAASDLNDKIEGLKLGAVDYITKPYQAEELFARVTTHIKYYQQLQLIKKQEVELAEAKIIRQLNEDLIKKNEEYSNLNEEYITLNEELNQRNEELLSAKESAELNREKIQTLFNTMTEGVALNEMIFDDNGVMVDYKVLEVNKAFYNFIEQKDKLVIGNTASNLYGMTPEIVKNFWEHHKENTTTVYSEFKSPLFDKWYYIATSPFVNNQFVTIFFDITKLKESEIELIKAKEKAEASQAKYKETVTYLNKAQSVAKIGSWKWNITDNSLDWSPEMFKVFEIDEKKFTGNLSDVMMQRIHPEDLDKVNASNTSVVEKGIPIPLEYRLKFPDGRIKTVWGEAGELQKNSDGNSKMLSGIVQDISERKLIENQLNSEKEKFGKIFSKAPVLISITDYETGVYADVNDFAFEFTGFTKEEVIGLKSTEIGWITPENRELLVNTLIKYGKIEGLEMSFTAKSGEIVYGLVYGEKLIINEKPYLLTITTDITQRKKAQEALQDRELKYRYLAENIQDVIWVLDVETLRFTYVSPSVEKLRGYTVEEVLNQTAIEVLTPDSQAFMLKVLPERIEKRYSNQDKDLSYTDEIEQLCKDGSTVWTEVITQFTIKASGKIEIIGSSRNINERKKTDAELKKAIEKSEENEKKLRLSEEKLKLKLDFLLSPTSEIKDFKLTDIVDLQYLQEVQDSFTKATGVASVITDVEGNPITKPSNFCGVCNLIRTTEKGRQNCFRSDKIIGQNAARTKKPKYEECYSCGFIDAGAPILINDQLIGIWMIGQSNIGNVDHTKIANYALEIGVDKEQMLIEYDKMESMSLERFNEITNLLWLIAKEISSLAYNNLLLAKKIEEQKEYEINLLEAKEKAEESDRLKTAFLQNMSHEIRTPMNAIIGFSELLVRYFNNKPKLEQSTSIIIQRCSDLLAIIDDILDIAKIESGQVQTHFDSCDMQSFFSELEIMFNENKKRLNKAHINFRIEAEYDPISSVIQTDSVKLKQIFTNLIGNAFKFTPVGEIVAGCKLDKNNKMLFYVSDTGIGIPKEKQSYIFERFAQLESDTSRFYGGTGLGLSIVNGLIKIFNGTIWLESEPQKGTTFYFSIPYNYSELVHPNNIVIESSIESSTITGSILIVEDDSFNATFIKEVLSETGLTIYYTAYGNEAISLALENEIDIILMDIRLPDISGYKAIMDIKKAKPQQKIIAQTAYAAQSDKEKAFSAGCDDYISKPLKSELLLSKIEILLNRK